MIHKAICSSHSANIYKKDMNPTIFPPDIGRIVGQTDPLTFVWLPVLKENWIQTC